MLLVVRLKWRRLVDPGVTLGRSVRFVHNVNVMDESCFGAGSG